MKVLYKSTNKIEEVKDSYAINYLIPKGIAVMATSQILGQVEKKEQKKQAEFDQKLQKQGKLAVQLDGKEFVIKEKANDKGELYGSIGKQQIKKILKIKEPIDIKLPEPIKHVGNHPLDLKIGKNRVKITLIVEAS